MKTNMFDTVRVVPVVVIKNLEDTARWALALATK